MGAPRRMKTIHGLLILAMFTPPNADQRRAAIGDTHGLPAALQRALDPAAFAPIPPPGPSDWLANHTEAGQTYDQFVGSHPNRPTAAAPDDLSAAAGRLRIGAIA
jgi:hypothetical protein